MTPTDRAQLEKEIQGLTARLRWEHIGNGLKEVWRMRIEELKARLAREKEAG